MVKRAHDGYNVYCDNCDARLITFGDFEAGKCGDCVQIEENTDPVENIEITEDEWYELS